jgi:hypothetical protein
MDETPTPLAIFTPFDWLTPIAHAIMGYTVVLFESYDMDEAAIWCFALRINGVDCVLGGMFGYYYVLGKPAQKED